jgi:hypothetical protein
LTRPAHVGGVLRAGHEGGDDGLLVWNGIVARFPTPAVQPASTQDDAAAIGPHVANRNSRSRVRTEQARAPCVC